MQKQSYKTKQRFYFLTLLIGSITLCMPSIVWATIKEEPFNLHLTTSLPGGLALIIFGLAYLLVIAEEFLDLRKSKPVILAAGLIWILVANTARTKGLAFETEAAIKQNLLEYAELFLFLLVAMTYVNTMEERKIFQALRAWLVKRNFSYRKLFWITGILAFFISPIADNLTTALVMCSVVMAVGADAPKFVALACINIVVAANAGGAFSPFGDITTLMVWQKEILPFQDFFHIFVPAAVSYVVPACCMHFSVPKHRPKPLEEEIKLALGAKTIVLLFLLTITTAVFFHNFLHLPPTIGMMTGLAYLQFYGYYLKRVEGKLTGKIKPFDVFRKVQRCEWDTLLFFYGVILCVGGLATFGYLSITSEIMYTSWGENLSAMHAQTPANVMIGILSSVVDNIPVMFAVLTMDPSMSEGQWLLVTLTAGIGGSLLSIGSAAGVALMGHAQGMYTFFSHLRWTWAIGLGYIAGILTHIWWNAKFFA